MDSRKPPSHSTWSGGFFCPRRPGHLFNGPHSTVDFRLCSHLPACLPLPNRPSLSQKSLIDPFEVTFPSSEVAQRPKRSFPRHTVPYPRRVVSHSTTHRKPPARRRK
jgi:hypothetical protein